MEEHKLQMVSQVSGLQNASNSKIVEFVVAGDVKCMRVVLGSLQCWVRRDCWAVLDGSYYFSYFFSLYGEWFESFFSSMLAWRDWFYSEKWAVICWCMLGLSECQCIQKLFYYIYVLSVPFFMIACILLNGSSLSTFRDCCVIDDDWPFDGWLA